MKKDIVFVIPNLTAGGGEKSLVSLLNVMDYSLYNVDLILLSKQGNFFYHQVPKEVNLIYIEAADYQMFIKNLKDFFKIALKKLRFKLAYHRLVYTIKNYFIKNHALAEQKSWKDIKSTIPVFEKEYDTAIAFLEKTSIYIVIDKIKAKKKIGFIHTNYSSSGMSEHFDFKYFKKLDNIVTVSKECANDLKEKFPPFVSKILVIHNIISKKTIQSLASRATFSDEIFIKAQNKILTIARLSHEKGIDIAIEAATILLKKGADFKWFVIGDGAEREPLKNKIAAYNLENNVFLLGLKDNPYPYIKNTDIYVQPSRYEGKSICVDEAKILHKPIIITNYPTAKDQINTLENGIISSMEPAILANDIENLLNDLELQKKLITNLSNEIISNENEINKLYSLIHD
jgi:glycosyltransferase involved in cell wall biosynthesis